MGIKERQERDREAVRRAILDAARELFVAEGFQNVSIRKIAERIEYSPAAIYGYFPSKDDIFFSLAEEGFRLLGSGNDREGRRLDTLEPVARVREIFWHVYEFSREHPQYFALMFVDRYVPRISREYERFAFLRDMKGEVVARIQECIDVKAFPSTLNAAVACRMLMMAVLGVGAVGLSDRLGPREQADVLAGDVLDAVLSGLQSGVRLHAMDECPVDEAATRAKVS